jgi:hypothetical protein
VENLLHQSIVELFYNLVLKVYFSSIASFYAYLHYQFYQKNVKHGHNWGKKRRQGVKQGEIEW